MAITSLKKVICTHLNTILYTKPVKCAVMYAMSIDTIRGTSWESDSRLMVIKSYDNCTMLGFSLGSFSLLVFVIDQFVHLPNR